MSEKTLQHMSMIAAVGYSVSPESRLLLPCWSGSLTKQSVLELQK